MSPHEFWERKHRKYAREPWIREPNYFATEVRQKVLTGAQLLDLGCGQGQDSVYFARHGLSVTSMDFCEFALSAIPEGVPDAAVEKVCHSLADICYPFAGERFDVVYSHLSMHYFDQATTERIFAEIYRLLRPGGLLAVMVNSIDDPEFGEGEKIEDCYYHVNDGDFKHYFSSESLWQTTDDLFVCHLLEQRGHTRKDPHQAFVRLIACKEQV